MSAPVPPHLQLPAVSCLSHRVIRVMGLNPGPMTLGGTNTYLVGSGRNRLLVDTGQGVAEYPDVLQQALSEASDVVGHKVSVNRIILTHWHHDHIGGLRDMNRMFPEAQVLKAPTKLLPADSPLSLVASELADGALIRVDDDCTLRAVMTPGHTDDHIALVLEEERAVFTGDCILGTGSSVFASYCDFMQSLELIRKLGPAVLYPGHGPEVLNATPYVEQYIAHRERREAQICKALEDSPCKTATILELVDKVYGNSISQDLIGAAAQNVTHQLKKLLRDRRVDVYNNDRSASEEVLGMDDYIASASSSMITRARSAASLSSPSNEGSCGECAESEAAGADVFAKLKDFRWRLLA